jgi:hypothetical protein
MPCDCKTKDSAFESILFDFIVGECNRISPEIETIISPDGHTLNISNISELHIGSMRFPVNGDNDNNKLSLVNVNVYKQHRQYSPILVPGLNDLLKIAFKTSNSKGYISSHTIHTPFAEIPGGLDEPARTVPELTDTLTGLVAYTTPTYGTIKVFSITLTNTGCGTNGCICQSGQCVPNGTPIP